LHRFLLAVSAPFFLRPLWIGLISGGILSLLGVATSPALAEAPLTSPVTPSLNWGLLKSTSHHERLKNLELSVYQKSYESQSLDQRLDRLETSTLGYQTNRNLHWSERLEQLEAYLSHFPNQRQTLSQQDWLQYLETRLMGQANPNLPAEERVAQLERVVFGQTNPELPLPQRLKRLGELVAIKPKAIQLELKETPPTSTGTDTGAILPVSTQTIPESLIPRANAPENPSAIIYTEPSHQVKARQEKQAAEAKTSFTTPPLSQAPTPGLLTPSERVSTSPLPTPLVPANLLLNPSSATQSNEPVPPTQDPSELSQRSSQAPNANTIRMQWNITPWVQRFRERTQPVTGE
jgi:uncharacterized protein YqcC (DUF446 family)